MSKPTAKALPSLLQAQSLLCALAGLGLGQVVLAIAAHHAHSLIGFGYALLFVLSGGASVALYLKHLHLERRPRGEAAPMNAWLLMLGVGVLSSLQLGGLG